MSFTSLVPYGWTDRWSALLSEHPGCLPARVVRHDSAAVLAATPDGVSSLLLSRNLDPAPTVGDWLAVRDGTPIAVLPRTSLLRRRMAGAEREQALAANVDTVLLVCGLDRPVRPGRIRRGATLAWDAGAVPVIVLTKSTLADDAEEIRDRVAAENPGLDVVITSAREGVGIDAVRSLTTSRTVVVLGESGAGKSTLVNALAGHDVTSTGAVRAGDAKGRHTTTARELHVLPGSGVLIDTPGLREVGLWVDADAVSSTFLDVEALAEGCRFTDCRHDGEPGCAVAAAIERGELAPGRVESWRELRREAESAERRAVTHERRRYEKQFAKLTKEAQRRKGR